MARVTIERSLAKVNSRFELAVLTSYRAHAIACGSQTAVNANNKFAVLALREIENGKIDVDQLKATIVEKYALESQVNTAKNSFIINDYFIKDDVVKNNDKAVNPDNSEEQK